MTSLEFTITTASKRSNWIFEAARQCNSLNIDTRDCGCFEINGKSFIFEFDSDMKINGLIRIF